MAESAPQRQYRQELIAEFEEGMSWLRQTTVTEAVIKGNEAIFLVGGSGGAKAVTRGINGLIPARADSLTQSTLTLTEWHDLVRKTRFNIFQSYFVQYGYEQVVSFLKFCEESIYLFYLFRILF